MRVIRGGGNHAYAFAIAVGIPFITRLIAVRNRVDVPQILWLVENLLRRLRATLPRFTRVKLLSRNYKYGALSAFLLIAFVLTHFGGYASCRKSGSRR